MDSSALVMSCHVANFEIPWLRKLSEYSLLASLGFGDNSESNTSLDEPATDEDLDKMTPSNSEPKSSSSFASTEVGEGKRLPSFISSLSPSSVLSSDSTEGDGGVSQFQLTVVSGDDVGSDDDLLSMCPISDSDAARIELSELDTGRHSGMAMVTTEISVDSAPMYVSVAHREDECTSECKPISDSTQGDHMVSNESPIEGTSGLDEVSWDVNVTTVMIRQLPLHCTQAMLMAELTERGLGNAFDFLYLPWDLKKRENLGYGFINFLEPTHALACRDAFHGTYLPLLVRRKPLNVHPAHLQGYEANHKHFVSAKMGKKPTPARFDPIFLPRDSASGSQQILPRKPTKPRRSKTSNSQKPQKPQQNEKHQ